MKRVFGLDLTRAWRRRPAVSHGPLRRLGALARLPELASVEALCEATGGPVTVFGKDGRQRELAGALEGLPFYEEGETLYFRRLEQSVPALAAQAARLAAALDVWPQDVAVEAFASRDGAGTRMHFDAEQNFNVQLRGRKTWRVAPNATVAEPLGSFVAGGRPTAELRACASGTFPARMPRTARVFEVRPGSALYVPRGWWHETRVRGDSLAVCFAVKPPVWADVLLDGLRRRLIRDPVWREGVFGLAGEPERRAALRGRLDELLPGLAAGAAALETDEVLPPALSPGRPYRWRAGVRRRVVSGEDGWSLETSSRGRTAVVELDDELVPLARWLAARGGPFRAPYDRPEFADLPEEDLDALLGALKAAGALS